MTCTKADPIDIINVRPLIFTVARKLYINPYILYICVHKFAWYEISAQFYIRAIWEIAIECKRVTAMQVLSTSVYYQTLEKLA
jgi:hypothetical protein